MDASPIVQALILFVVVTAMTRFVLAPLARAGDGGAILFGPQDRTVRWPRDVQESDEPWGWRPLQQAADGQSARAVDRGGDPGSPGPEGLVESRAATFTVPVASVASIRVGVRRH